MSASGAEPAASGAGRRGLLLTLLLGLALRLGTFPEVFADGRVLLDSVDGYYHLRRALLTLATWPHLPLRDPFMGPPTGGLMPWSLFDLLLATLAKLHPGDPVAALEAIGARLPVLFGVLQVVLAWALGRRFAGPVAGVAAAFAAAVLPAAVRFGQLGMLDHDTQVELLAVVALLGLAAVLGPDGRRLAGPTLLLAVGLATTVLTFPCSLVQLALVGCSFLAAVACGGFSAAARGGAALCLGATAAAALVTPLAIDSPWNDLGRRAFSGLSLVHVGSLAGLGLAGAVVALLGRSQLTRRARLATLVAAALALVALAVLLPRILGPLLAGLRFASTDDAFLGNVAEYRPLLWLLGPFDLAPALIRLGALPLLVPPIAWVAWRRRSAPLGLLAGWGATACAMALVQARYTHPAAIALAVVFGVAWQALRRPAARVALAMGLVPCVAAYVPVPGQEGMCFYGRTLDLRSTGMLEVTDLLARLPPPSGWLDAEGNADGAVLSPWSWGFWIQWLGRRPTLANGFGPYGQEGFGDGVRFWLLTDPAAARASLLRHQVRWVVAPTQPMPPASLASLAGDDPAPWTETTPTAERRFLHTMGVRLAWAKEVAGFREVYRTRASQQLPDGSLRPLLRVWEVLPDAAPPAAGPAAPTTAPGRAPSGP